MKSPEMVSGGIPVLGHLIDFVTKQDQLLQRGAREKGKIFGLNLMGQKVAILTGPEAKESFFKETDRTLNMEEAYEFLAAIFGKVAFLADHQTYQNHRPILHDLFSRSQMKGKPVMPPVYLTATYQFKHSDDLTNIVQEREGNIYSRWDNPSVMEVEKAQAALEGDDRSLGFSSGMAAISTTLLAFLKSGSGVVSTREIYVGTYESFNVIHKMRN